MIAASLDAGMPLENILTLFDDMHALGIFASNNAYSIALQRVAKEVRYGSSSGLPPF